MEQKAVYQLTVDQAFSTLIHPLSKDELLRLEENILRDGCIDPIVVWDNVIVDGHNRYSICTKHAIPFAIKNISFSCRQEAIAWICANQLGRRNISIETRRYLIGKQYEAEKIANRLKNSAGNNQFQTKESGNNEITEESLSTGSSGHITAHRIAVQHNVSQRTVERCGAFTRAIEQIEKANPEIASLILSGKYNIPQKQIHALAEMQPCHLLSADSTPKLLTSIGKKCTSQSITPPSRPSVKDMPKHDPDGEATTLSLTVPSWKDSIDRVISVADMKNVSAFAKKKMREALLELIVSAETLLKLISNSD